MRLLLLLPLLCVFACSEPVDFADLPLCDDTALYQPNSEKLTRERLQGDYLEVSREVCGVAGCNTSLSVQDPENGPDFILGSNGAFIANGLLPPAGDFALERNDRGEAVRAVITNTQGERAVYGLSAGPCTVTLRGIGSGGGAVTFQRLER